MRRTELDLCRITACLGVILSHATADGFHIEPIWTWRFWILCLVSTVVRATIPQFFMISGTLLLERATMDPWKTLKKRTGHLWGLFLFWSLAYVDWYQDDQPTSEAAFAKLIPRIHNGAVVLLHSTSSTNVAILDELLTRWESMGYRFGTLSELFAP